MRFVYQICALPHKIHDLIISYRNTHKKPAKEYTFTSLCHSGIQIIGAAMAADICAGHVVMIEQAPWVMAGDPINNPMYWYYSFAFIATGIIAGFGLWDLYSFGVNQVKLLHENTENATEACML